MNDDDTMIEVTLTLNRTGTLHMKIDPSSQIDPIIVSTLVSGMLTRALATIREKEVICDQP